MSNSTTSNTTTQPEFWNKVNKNSTDECWEWLFAKNKDGYGMVKFNGSMQLAHRVAWQKTIGLIPDGMCVLHRCDNRSCVRVSHLFLGTRKDNSDDRCQKNRTANGSEVGSAKLTESDIPRIRKMCASGMTQRDVAKKYGVTQSAIQLIVVRKNWSHVP